MSWMGLVAIACALAMDAFAVAIIAGLTYEPMTGRRVFRLAFHFGLFQAVMPTIGWAVGSVAHGYVERVDHWIALGLLAIVGGRMIHGALAEADDRPSSRKDPTSGWSLVMLSVATSIDALAVGLTLAMLGTTILVPAVVIGLITAAFTTAGVLLGRRIGSAWSKRVEVLGGLILIAIGVKIVIEHVFG
jgi:manganese efflux pump family protein